MVNAPEAAALLAHAAGFDNRKPDAQAARAWADALADIDFEDALAAIVAHYATETRWIMPADVRAGVKVIEQGRLSSLPNLYELEPPESVKALIDDDEAFNAAYLDWIKEQGRRARKGLPLEVGPDPVPGPRQLVS